MSSLNLIPNPQVVVAQAAIFLAHIYVVNKLLLAPFLSLKSKQDAATNGSEQEAKILMEKYTQTALKVEQRLGLVLKESLDLKKRKKDEARQDQQRMLAAHTQKMESELSRFRQELSAAFLVEKKKISSITERVVDEIYRKITL